MNDARPLPARAGEVKSRIEAYLADRKPGEYEEITLCLLQLGQDTLRPGEDLSSIEGIMGLGARAEAVWSLLAGQIIWKNGARTPQDFQNVWSCSRFAGLSSRYSHLSAAEHLRRAESWPPETAGPTLFIVRGNAYRQLHR